MGYVGAKGGLRVKDDFWDCMLCFDESELKLLFETFLLRFYYYCRLLLFEDEVSKLHVLLY